LTQNRAELADNFTDAEGCQVDDAIGDCRVASIHTEPTGADHEDRPRRVTFANQHLARNELSKFE
jgi:hypothetical protein